jgi:hypothetical protein
VRSIRRAVANLFLAAAAVAATLALAEAAARRLLPEWAPVNGSRAFWRYDALLGWSHRPGANGIHRERDFAVRVETSSQGLRDRVYPEQRAAGLCRMLVAGDSFAWGFGVEREEIWHERIERRHAGWELVNAGVAGYATDQELLYLEHQGLALRPDVVLLQLHANDFLENGERSTSGYYKPYFSLLEGGWLEVRQLPVPQRSLAQRFDRWLRHHTYLLYRAWHPLEFAASAREARAAANAAADVAADVAAPPARSAPPPAGATSKYDVDLALTLRLLARIDALVRERGARFLLVSVPMPEPPRARFEAGVRALGITHLPLDAAFRKQRDVLFAHDPHWTPRGHEVAAAAVEAFLEAQGVLAGDGHCGRSGS